MIYKTNMIIYPEGDQQEIQHLLHIYEMVDVNGNPLSLPLSSGKIIAFRVYRINTRQTRNEEIREHHLEIIPVTELEGYVR
ncbi:MAG: hypothetical protein JW904_10800 [Spirochaetales bacterium]|nr:hypothetical protein [Spirochaetales bacterium]